MRGVTDALYVTPVPPETGITSFLLATGDSETDLAALGPTNPPIPTRCCAICNGDEYEGFGHTLSFDVAQSTIVTSCASFSLHYWNDEMSLHSWYCIFHNSSHGWSAVDPEEPVFHYLPTN